MATLPPKPVARLRVAKPSRPASATVGDIYLWLLLLFAPVASYLVIPVQGVTPANIMLFASLAVPFFGLQYQVRFIAFIGFAIMAYSLLLVFAMSGYAFSNPDLRNLIEIRRGFVVGALRQTHITQGVYLLTSVIFAYHIYNNYTKKVLDAAYISIIIFVAYGFYQFLYFAVFQTSGDFISNRGFGDFDITNNEGEGGLLQRSILLGSRFIRFYSLTGEPSFFSLTTVPFFVFAVAMRSWKLAGFLFVALFLSNSTTAVIGIGVGLFVIYSRNSRYILFGIPSALFVFALFYFTSDFVANIADKLLFDKLGTGSGQDRLQSMTEHLAVVVDGNVARFLFGLGFGTIRSPDMFSTLLANIGLVGLLLYSAIILAPAFLLPKSPVRLGLQAVLWSIWVMEMLSVSEFSYLPPWFFVAMAYWHCFKAPSLSAEQMPPRRNAAARGQG